jgi:hypothetical protein
MFKNVNNVILFSKFKKFSENVDSILTIMQKSCQFTVSISENVYNFERGRFCCAFFYPLHLAVRSWQDHSDFSRFFSYFLRCQVACLSYSIHGKRNCGGAWLSCCAPVRRIVGIVTEAFMFPHFFGFPPHNVRF